MRNEHACAGRHTQTCLLISNVSVVIREKRPRVLYTPGVYFLKPRGFRAVFFLIITRGVPGPFFLNVHPPGDHNS